MYMQQGTIKKKITISGLGLHCGLPVKLKLSPAEIDNGIIFYRTDLKKSLPIKAHWKNVINANLCTKISNDNGDYVITIEHFMFSLYSLGITNLNIEIDGPEVPILDGSAKIFIEELSKAGLLLQNKKLLDIEIIKTITVQEKNKFIKYEPTRNNFLEINYTIDFQDQFIKKQNFILKNVQKNFLEVYQCRTFCHQEDLEKIFAMGLAKGGSLDNAVVISGAKILNQEGLRYKDEFVRHKILDCIGDLYLSGFFFNGKITCVQGGHELTANLIRKIFENTANYSIGSNISKKKIKKNTDKLTSLAIQAVV